MHVGVDHERTVTAFFQQFAEFGGGRGFVGAVKTDEGNLEWAGAGEVGQAFAKELNQLVVNDFTDLLAGGDSLERVFSKDLLLDAFDEFVRATLK
jgi:hypothetical protein